MTLPFKLEGFAPDLRKWCDQTLWIITACLLSGNFESFPVNFVDALPQLCFYAPQVKGSEDKLYTTIELTHEQMLDERNAAHGSESFQSSAYKCETCILGFQYRRPYEAHLSSRHAKVCAFNFNEVKDQS